MISFVVAVAENGVIGYRGELPWGRLPADLQHFKLLTLGHPVVMGRRTFDSLGRALPKRANIVVTRQPKWTAPGCETASSVSSALAWARELDDEVCVIGGGEIYRAALPDAEIIYLTEIHHSFEGDAYFPELDPAEWHEETRERHEVDAEHAYAFSFVTLRRK